jgi:hypothetical protein
MARNSLELFTKALERLQRVAAGQDPSAEDVEICRNQLGPLLEELAVQEVYFLADVEAIPDLSFLPLANRLAAEVAPDFGLGATDPSVMASLNRRLRLTWIGKPLYVTQRALYY